jgi:predicted transglutaminase-like cysteine proteinase
MKHQLDAGRRLVLTQENWSLLRSINRRGNQIEWTSDEENWGVNERWELPKEVGGRKLEDCDGITLWKMHELMKLGVPASPLLFTICMTEANEGHAVLCVVTDRGDFILDNRFDEVKTYDQIKAFGYRVLYRSTVGGKLNDVWSKIKELR